VGGQLKSKGNYKDGKEDGLSDYYDKKGQLKQKANYKVNQPGGVPDAIRNGNNYKRQLK
jgi:antitoxin component YwqK of YwqJK toxin-antitoxin module